MSADARAQIIASIETAVAYLGQALDELDRTPMADPAATGLVARALESYLTVSDAALDLLADSLGDHGDPDVETWLSGLRRLGHMMRHMIGRLAYAGAPADMPLHLERVDLVRLMTRACRYYEEAATRKRLEIGCQAVDDVPLVWADRAAVAVVADNLLSNAVKHSKPDGRILVQITTGPGGVVCGICDNGPGLSPQQQALLRKSPQTGAAASAGTPSPGHGLAITLELVERLGGQLWFEHDPMVGPSVLFRLPYPPSESAG